MPRAYDRQQLSIDRNPLHQLSTDLSKLPTVKLPPFDELWRIFVRNVQDLTGINLSSPAGLVQSIFHVLVEAVANGGQTIEGAVGMLNQIIAGVEAATGLVFTDGPEVFLTSLVNSLTNAFNVNLSSPQALVESIIDNIATSLTNVAGFLTLVVNQVQQELQALGLPTPQWVAQQIEQALENFLDKTGLDDLIDAIFSGWHDGPPEILNPFAAFTTIRTIKDAIDGLNAQINALNGGTVENFSTYPDGSPGAKWSIWLSGTGSGIIRITQGKMLLNNPAIFTSRSGFARYNAVKTPSDYQKVGLVFGSSPYTNILGDSAVNIIVGRLNDDDGTASTYVYVRMGLSGASIGYHLGGVNTNLRSFPGFRFRLGSTYWLECGVKGVGGAADQPMLFRLWENANIIFEATDSLAKSAIGANNRWSGVGFYNPALQSANVASFALIGT